MTSGAPDRPELNESQKRRLRVTCRHIDKQLMDVEAVLHQSASKAAFPKYAAEIPLAQRSTIEGYIARIRAQLLRILDGQNIEKPAPNISPIHSINVSLTFAEIAAEELYPKYMRGYGDVPEPVATELNGIVGELLGLVSKLSRYVGEGIGADLKERLEHLDRTSDVFDLLREVERVVAQRGMVEYRQAIANILDRAEDKSFEIAVFGRVSSGKSSLLNAILGAPILPVGVTPITAVPTRIVHGQRMSLTVAFADRPSQTLQIALLPDFVTEQRNPGNQKHVSRIVVELPAARLQNGVSFVDTPGLGSLATSGAAETLAYLPKCDLGVVLIDAGSTLTPDDIQTIQSLHEATVPAAVLLSKADLLSDQDRVRILSYVKEQVFKQCNMDLAVHAVSAIPSHHNLLDEWFQAEILPLYERCQELRTASVKRKVGSLRDSVVASLQARIRVGAGSLNISVEKTREAETRLRVAHGNIEATAFRVEEETESMASRLQAPIESSAAALVEFWRGKNISDVSAEVCAHAAFIRAVQSRVREMREEIESLAESLAEDLEVSAQALGISDKPNREEFMSIVRELPVFDPPLVKLELHKPASLAFLGKRLAHGMVRRSVERDLGPQLSAVLQTYSGLLRRWALDVLRELRAHFESYADNYRARAAACSPAEGLSSSETEAIRNDLLSSGVKDMDQDASRQSEVADV
ncbi:MAG TPA: dynamin family protein [Candidatus Acidoferrales bacterium]